MAVGVAAIPAGALYAFLAARGYESRWTILLAIIFGCVCARWAWKFVDRKFTAPQREFAFPELLRIETRRNYAVAIHQQELLLLARHLNLEEPNAGAVHEQSGLSEAQSNQVMEKYAAAGD